MSIYDPTCGSGGMLIQSRDYVRESGGDPRDLALFGQESNGTTWSICKMNMLLHGIAHADIRQGDTIRRPAAHGRERRAASASTGSSPIRRSARTTSRRTWSIPGASPSGMPEKGKKADLMFVQHMLAVLKADGKMATVMPHGVLFRGGEEKRSAQALHRGRLAGGDHRPARRPVLRHRHPGLRAGDEQEGRRQPQARPLHQRRPRIPRGQGPELPAARGHRARSSTSTATRQDVARLRPPRAGERDRGRGLQLQHPPLRRQRPAARAARRARPSARRRAR